MSKGGDFYNKVLLAKTLSKLELMPHLILWKADSKINCYERFSFENTSCITVITNIFCKNSVPLRHPKSEGPHFYIHYV